jgi:alkylhydroperoxidase family enzyme
MANIAYVDLDAVDDDIREFIEVARRTGTPRPEIQAVRAQQPDVLRAFVASWKVLFKGGIVDFHLKELLRMRVATSLECNYWGEQRAVQVGQQGEAEQIAAEDKIAQLENFETSDLFDERERVALRYTDAITWNPDLADAALWEDLHRHFTDPELVEIGSFVGYIAGTQRWIHTLEIRNGDMDAEGAIGLSAAAAERHGI